MGGIPGVGTVRGVFELFLPGLFLLLNLVGAVYSSPVGHLDPNTPNRIEWLASDIPSATALAIPIGYLVGVILRLFKTGSADSWSALYLKKVDQVRQKVEVQFGRTCGMKERHQHYSLLYESTFPYNKVLELTVSEMLPARAMSFYESIWADHGDTKQFVNFCKVLVSSKDQVTGAEIASAEAMSRFVASMMYAQVASIGAFLLSILFGAFTHQSPEAWVLLLILGYSVGIWSILRSLRFLRLKEVEMIFAATFANKDQLSL